MATTEDPAAGIMPTAELKPLLVLSKRQQVSCAVGLTKDKQGIVLLHRRTRPRKLLAELRRKAGAGVSLDPTSLRFGRATVDGANDSTTVHFTVNKPAPGVLRVKLLERLRPVGFQHCEIHVDEALEIETDDDAASDDADGPTNAKAPSLADDADARAGGRVGPQTPLPASGKRDVVADDGSGATTPAAAAGSVGPVGLGSILPPSPTGAGQAALPSADALKSDLTGLVKRIAPTIAADPSRKEPLLKIANDANARLKAGDAAGTQAGIEALRGALFLEPAAAGADKGLLTPVLSREAWAPTSAVPKAAGALGRNLGPLSRGLRFVGVRAVGLLALLIPDKIDERTTTDEDVKGHSDLGGQVVRAPGDLSGTVEITGASDSGGSPRTLVELSMDPNGDLRERGWQGTVLGHVNLDAGTIILTADGEAFLQRKAEEAGVTLAPSAAGDPSSAGNGDEPHQPGTPGLPQAPAPDQQTQRPAWMDELNGIQTRDDDERRFIEQLAQSGMKHADILTALEERRRGGGGATRGQDGTSSNDPVVRGQLPAQPTPRDGVIGGKPTGRPERIDQRADRNKQDGLRLQTASEDAIAAAGYRVERSPVVQPGERLTPDENRMLGPKELDPQGRVGPRKNPDARIGGNLADMVAPKTPKPEGVRDALSDKIKDRQAYRLVLNLGRTDVTREQIEALLKRKPIAGLQELFIIERNGAIFRVFPEPGQITPAAQAR